MAKKKKRSYRKPKQDIMPHLNHIVKIGFKLIPLLEALKPTPNKGPEPRKKWK